MKSSDRLPSITAPLLKDTLTEDKLRQVSIQNKLEAPVVVKSSLKPPTPAELDQDAGGGFNPNHVLPQE